MRSISAKLAVPKTPKYVPNVESYDIEVITPMFGGGVTAGEVDTNMPVRATSIRGHLRTWWRILYRDEMPSEILLKKESAIWGSTDSPSLVDVRIKSFSRCNTEAPCSIEPNGPGKSKITFKKYPQYVLFPFQGSTDRDKEMPPKEMPPKKGILKGLKFTLELALDSSLSSVQTQQVENALRAWVNFGGIGARTRRGCGSLYCEKLAFSNEVELSSMLSLGKIRGRIGAFSGDSVETWIKIINTMKSFRQSPGIGRNEGTQSNRPGRSRWPEPDSIRRLTGNHSNLHSPAMTVKGFPRACFGMPIIFHFKDKDHDDPSDCELKLEEGSRMGSPVLLRPLKMKNGKIVPLALLIAAPELKTVILTNKQQEYSIPASQIINPNFTNYQNSPMKKRSADGNALEAYWQYLGEQGYREVK